MVGDSVGRQAAAGSYQAAMPFRALRIELVAIDGSVNANAPTAIPSSTWRRNRRW